MHPIIIPYGYWRCRNGCNLRSILSFCRLSVNHHVLLEHFGYEYIDVFVYALIRLYIYIEIYNDYSNMRWLIFHFSVSRHHERLTMGRGNPLQITRTPFQYPTGTVYWCIASKLKAPRNLYWMSNMFLWVEMFLLFVCYHVVPKRHSQLDYELNGL